MQIESIDGPLRNGLWSVFYEVIALDGRTVDNLMANHYADLMRILWKRFFKLPINAMPSYWNVSSEDIEVKFYSLSWFAIYDFVEFVAQNTGGKRQTNFINNCNDVLRQEMAGYRFVGDEIAQITSDEEIAEIEQAINETDTNAVSSHLNLIRALELLSDKTEPDYRNSIKESISAVKALCAKLTDSSATLGQALKRLEADGVRSKRSLSAIVRLYE